MNNFIKLLNAKKKIIKYESLYVNKIKQVFIILKYPYFFYNKKIYFTYT